MSNKEVKDTFNNIASEFSKKVHPYYTKRRSLAMASKAKGKILEIGSGPGKITRYLIKRGNVIAGDIAIEMLYINKKKHNIPFVVFDAEHIPFKKNTFDTIVMGEVIQYLDNPQKVFDESKYVLKKDGIFILSCVSSLWEFADKARDILNVFLKLFGKSFGWSDNCYNKGFMDKDMKKMMQKTGFKEISSKGIVFFPFSSFDRINKILEKTIFKKYALGSVVWGKKQ